jgi:excisionase family DNA binding protein
VSALPQLATPQEIADYLGVTVETVQRMLRRGDVPGTKLGGRWYVHLGHLAAQLDDECKSSEGS